jgi:hypothetical protein
VIAAVGQEDDRGEGSEIMQCVEERLREVRVGRATAAVQKDEQRSPASSPMRKDEHLV